VLEYDGDNEGRVQTDNEYKLTILLIYLVRTIKMFHIRNHMHCAGSHEFPIPTPTACATCMCASHMSAMRSQVIRLSPAYSQNPLDYLIVTISLSYLSFVLP